ncbi:hypothetical protein [Nitriliruptor alkaliphilus]|uniref:hypothetical protein n=1 Tax=Nitriliruptor alkaliphilus TaxID=427918 RepID=UPI0006970DC6|nr:hypothetical protein [Nitriliruptor alkaliphilus]
MTGELVAAWRGAQLAEVAWVTPAGTPRAAVVVPLLDEGLPALALPYAELDLATSLAEADRVTFSVAVPAVAGGASPVAAAARIAVTEDPRGEAFTGSPLLEQVLAKHPPSRRRLDSLLLRREHAWYVPRVLVRTTEIGPSFDLGVGEALGVAVSSDGGPWVALAHDVAVADGTARLAVDDGPATVLAHGADVPDLDQPWHRRWTGTVRDLRFRADERDEVAPARRRASLRDRVRTERALERACRAGLRQAGHR